MKSPLRPGCLLLVLALPVAAQDKADIETARIRGHREAPQVFYIVPWKKPALGTLSARPERSVLDEPLQWLDPEEFRRTLAYAAARAPAVAASAAAAAASAPSAPSASSAPSDTPGVPR